MITPEELDPDNLRQRLAAATNRLARQSSLLRIAADKVVVVGDTHGDADSSWSAISNHLKGGATLLFLGDYVDRGPYQLENLLILLISAEDAPERLLMLRGNHEIPEMNRWYGFLEVVSDLYGPGFYSNFSAMFAQLSITALINDRFLAVHGGLAHSLRSISQLAELPKGAENPSGIVSEVLWNDPDEDIEFFAPNSRGPGTFRYGRRAVSDFLKANGLDAIMRSHEPRSDGVSIEMGGGVYTVFSCRYYGIPPSALLIEGDEVSVLRL